MIHNKNRRGRYRRYRLDDPGFHPLPYAHMIEEYIRHPETKSLGRDSTPCMAETRGLLQRAHITAGRIRYIDKETSSTWAQSDDLSVLTDNDETGFRVVEYGKSRKVVLPDSLKREIKGAKLQRELRWRGIGQHTIEKALHSHVRVSTCRKIVAAIEAYKRQNLNRKCTARQSKPRLKRFLPGLNASSAQREHQKESVAPRPDLVCPYARSRPSTRSTMASKPAASSSKI